MNMTKNKLNETNMQIKQKIKLSQTGYEIT